MESFVEEEQEEKKKRGRKWEVAGLLGAKPNSDEILK